MGKKISIRERRRRYEEKYKRNFQYKWFNYCREPLENIEGWSEMLNDTSGQRWQLHHRDETQGDVRVSVSELKRRGEYLNLPASKLIFMTEHEHKKIHNIGKTLSAEHKKKMSESHKGKTTGENNGMYGRNKYDLKKEDLYELYVVQGLSQKKVAEKLRCTRGAIRLYLRKYKIKR